MINIFLRELKKLPFFVKKDIKLELSYKFSILLRMVGIALFCLVFFFLSKMFDGSNINSLQRYNDNYFSFAIIGISFYSFFAILLNSFSSRLREEQLTGTLEAILQSPITAPTFLSGLSVLSILRGILNILVFFIIGSLVLGAQLSITSIPLFIIVVILSTFSFLSIGIMAAAFILVFKKGNPINWIIQNLFLLTGGVIYPVSVLPNWLQNISKMIPITYSLELLRSLLIPGVDTTQFYNEIIILGIFTVILLPLSIISFNYALRIVKITGTLSQY